MTATKPQPLTQADLCAGVALVAREWDPDAAAERLTLTVPSRSDPTTRHTLTGHSHGRDAACDCPGFAYRRRCSHVAAWPVLVEELERRFYADPAYTTAGLLSLAEFYAAIPDLLSPEQRLRANGIRAALADRGVAVRPPRPSAARRAALTEELYG